MSKLDNIHDSNSSNNSSSNKLGNIRDRIENGFGRWGYFVTRHPWLVIALSVAVIASTATMLSKLYIDTSTEIFLHKGDPIGVAYGKFRQQFGREERTILMIDTEGSIFDLAFLEKLKALHDELENNIPKIQEVNSLINAQHIHTIGDELIIEDLLEEWPEESDLPEIKKIVMNHPSMRDQYIGKTDQSTLVLIQTDTFSSVGNEVDMLGGFDDDIDSDSITPNTNDNNTEKPVFLSGAENNEVVQSIDKLIKKYSSDSFKITAAGSPHITSLLMTILMEDMETFATMSLAIIALILALLFRRVVMIFLPLVISSLAIIMALSFMAGMQIPFTVITQIAPSFLLAVGVGNSVHFFTAFFQHFEQSNHSKQDAIIYALEHSGFAIAMTAFTTAGGLLSFTTADIKPIADFGLISAFGIIVVFLLSVILLPAIVSVIPIKQKVLKNTSKQQLNQRFLSACARLASTKPWHIVIISFLLVAITLFAALQLKASHDPTRWFKADNPLRLATERLDRDFGGSMFLEVLIDTKEKNGLYNPVLLHRIDELYQAAGDFDYNGITISKPFSIIDVNKEMHKALNGNNPDFYKIPDERALIAQELLLFENSGYSDLKKLTDTKLSKARITLRMPYVDAMKYDKVQSIFYPQAQEIIGDLAEVSFTGLLAIDMEISPALIRTLVSSYLLAFLIITPLMMIFLGSFATGLLSMIPNLTPIIIVLGAMKIFNIPLEAFTLLIGCVALGLAVDDTIHFMHNFQRFYRQSGNADKAVLQSLQTTGQALLFTSIVLTMAFFVYMMSAMSNLYYFGFLTGSCIILAFLSDVLLAPSLVILVARRKENKELKKQVNA